MYVLCCGEVTGDRMPSVDLRPPCTPGKFSGTGSQHAQGSLVSQGALDSHWMVRPGAFNPEPFQ